MKTDLDPKLGGNETDTDKDYCQNCEETNLEVFLDLTDQPICNRFPSSQEDILRERRYPLQVAYCHTCHLVQLIKLPPFGEIFGTQYNYLTGSTPEAQEYFDLMAYSLVKKYRLKP